MSASNCFRVYFVTCYRSPKAFRRLRLDITATQNAHLPAPPDLISLPFSVKLYTFRLFSISPCTQDVPLDPTTSSVQNCSRFPFRCMANALHDCNK
jgi:hypothetical protein